MYWLLRPAQHARDINIHKLHPLPGKKIGLGSADFLHSGSGYIDIAVFVPLLIFLPISVRIFQNASSGKFSQDFNHDFGERELTFTFSICYRPSVCRLSSVFNARAPYPGGSNFWQYFYGIRYLGHPLTVTENFTEIVPGEPLRRGS